MFFFSPFFFLFGCPCDITGHERTVHLYCTCVCVCVCKGIHRSAFFRRVVGGWGYKKKEEDATDVQREKMMIKSLYPGGFFFSSSFFLFTRKERERPWLSVITHHLFSRGEEEEEENRRIWFCIPYTNAWGYIFFDCLIVFFVFNFYVLKIKKKKKKKKNGWKLVSMMGRRFVSVRETFAAASADIVTRQIFRLNIFPFFFFSFFLSLIQSAPSDLSLNI